MRHTGIRRAAACAVLAAAVMDGACGARVEVHPQPVARPNVLVVLVDDLGWADTGAYGSPFYDTPAIDRLARDGVRFTQFYAASPVCSPTRASIMTGKHPARLHITDWIGGGDAGPLLPPAYEHQLALDEVTVGEAFQQAGYATGYLGKWHLGDGPFMPSAQGFGFTRAVNRAGQPASYTYPYQGPSVQPTSVPDLEGGAPGEYLTDRLTDEALAFIRTNRERPFFLVLSHYAVHTPLEAPASLVAKYEARATGLPAAGDALTRNEGPRAFTRLRQDHPVYASMVERTDASVGRLMAGLDELGLARGTIVVFVSDNGGLSTLTRRTGIPTSNEPLRAGKGWLYEGGLRVPLIVRWPGSVPPGRVVDGPGMTTDLYPTLLSLAGLPLRPRQHVDGVDLAPSVTGTGSVTRDTLFWHFPHYHGSGHTPGDAVRSGSLKLIEWFEDDHVELYDLASDPYERWDLAAARPAVVAELRGTLRTWRVAVDARVPSKNPNWPPRQLGR